MQVLAAMLACALGQGGGVHAGNIGLPQFSWNTLPVFFHSQNESGRWNSAALAQIARFPLVTIEKAHGCGQPSQCLNGLVPVEDNIAEACRAIHKVNPKTKVLFYSNSVIDYKMFSLHGDLVKNPSLRLKNDNGGDLDDKGSWAYNLAAPEMRALHRGDCLNVTDGGCDGCYIDKSNDMSQVCQANLNR